MRTLLIALALLVTATAALPSSGEAPADEYFGPFKYSALSVRTKIDALARSYNQRWADDASIVHDAGLVESSYRAWAQRYPKDSWLAPTAYHLAQLYQEIQTQDARNHARAMYQFLAQNFPASKEAHYARLRLQQGFPALHPEPAVSPTPSPYGPAAPSAPPSAEPSVAPAASAAPASPAPASPPAPSPAASSAPSAPAASSIPSTPPAPRPSPSGKPRG